MKPHITLEPHPSKPKKTWFCKYKHYGFGCLGNTPEEAYRNWDRNRKSWIEAQHQADLALVKTAIVIDKAMGVR